MQSIQHAITESFQIFGGNDTIVQKQGQLAEKLGASEFKLNTGTAFILTDALSQTQNLSDGFPSPAKIAAYSLLSRSI